MTDVPFVSGPRQTRYRHNWPRPSFEDGANGTAQRAKARADRSVGSRHNTYENISQRRHDRSSPMSRNVVIRNGLRPPVPINESAAARRDHRTTHISRSPPGIERRRSRTVAKDECAASRDAEWQALTCCRDDFPWSLAAHSSWRRFSNSRGASTRVDGSVEHRRSSCEIASRTVDRSLSTHRTLGCL